MDPFGDDAGDAGDLSNFQAPADAGAFNGDFYEVETNEMQADFGAPGQEEEEEEQPVMAAAPIAAAPVQASFPVVPEENELTRFMQKYEVEIAAKKAEQEKVAVECKDKAVSDMAQFVSERSRLKEAKQQSNRVAEQATLEKLAADLESDNPWERVVSLVDLEQNRKQRLAALKKEGKQVKETEPPAKKDEDEEDVSRMRQIFVQLKTTPLEATRT